MFVNVVVAGPSLADFVNVAATGPPRVSQNASQWFDRIKFGGDFRARSEEFLNSNAKDRHRLRYRLRLGAKSKINDYFDLGFRFATGPDANSGNQTLGGGSDFKPNGIFIDRAYLTLKPTGSEKPRFGDALDVTFGKMPNPFRPKSMGPALLIWDSDIMPEGVALAWSFTPTDFLTSNLDVAYFIFKENAKNKDPGIYAVQLDNDLEFQKDLHFKSQFSYYALRKLDDAFLVRSRAQGNTSSAATMATTMLRGTSGLSKNSRIDLVEFHGSMNWKGSQTWPVTVWGNVLFNTSATNKGQGRQDLAFGAGVVTGNKTAFAKLGLGYFHIEADALPATLGDSDLFDGVTNGKGFQAFITRNLWKNTDFDLRAYYGKRIHGGQFTGPPLQLQSKSPAKRVRIQTNILIKF